MKFQIMSDLHSEFMKNPERFVKRLPVEAPVLILAGDSGNARTASEFIGLLEERFERVLFVAGNHEYYGSEIRIVDETLTQRPGFLKRHVVDVDGVRVGGATLWFREHEDWKRMFINDFRCIEGLKEQFLEENRLDEEFIRGVVDEVDILITHHIPHSRGVAKRFRSSAINDFFLTPIADELERLPPVWIFGHTHFGCRFVERRCDFVCNPRGYGGEGRLERTLTLEVPCK